jgi:hypothetical protein
MLLKRKRSESELGSVFSSTQRPESGCFNFDAMSAMDTARRGFFAPRLSTPSHLHSRTRKRFRDNRPSETEVYRKSYPDSQSQSHSPQTGCVQSTLWMSSTRLSDGHTSSIMRQSRYP